MNDNKKNIPYRFTRYILPNQNFGRTLGLSRNVSQRLRERIHHTLYGLFEHGFTNQPMAPSRVIDPTGVLELGKMTACFEHVLGMKSSRDDHADDLPISSLSFGLQSGVTASSVYLFHYFPPSAPYEFSA